MESIQIKSSITSTDYRKFWIRRFAKNKQTIALVALLVTLIAVILITGIMPWPIAMISFLFLLFVPSFILYKAMKTYRSQPILNKPMDFIFTQDQVEIASSHLNKTLTYNQFQKLDLDHEFLLLYLNQNLALFLNRESVKSEGKEEDLYQFLEKKEGIVFNRLNK